LQALKTKPDAAKGQRAVKSSLSKNVQATVQTSSQAKSEDDKKIIEVLYVFRLYVIFTLYLTVYSAQ